MAGTKAMNRETPAFSRPLFITILLLGLAACAIRLWAVPHARFTTDESNFYETAVSVAQSTVPVPLYGPQITGGDGRLPGPMFNLVTAVPFLFGTHPYFGGIYMALLHAFTGLLFFLFMRTLAGSGAALIALGLFTVAPWDILYSDRLWASNLAPVWGMAALYATLRARDGAFWQTLAAFLALTLPQIHLSAPVLWAVMIILFLLKRPEKIVWRWFLLGAILAILSYAPTMRDDMRNNFANLHRIFDSGITETSAESGKTIALNAFLTLILFGSAEIGYHFSSGFWNEFRETDYYLMKGTFFSNLKTLPTAVEAGLIISIALSLGALLWLIVRLVVTKTDRERHVIVFLFLLSGFAIAVFLLAVSGKRFYPHYLNLLMPLALAPTALLLDTLRRWRFPTGAVIAGVLFVVSSSTMISETHRFYTTVDGRNSIGSIYGITAYLLEQKSSFAFSFSGFRNDGAFKKVAKMHFGKILPLRTAAQKRFIVHNGKDFPARGGGDDPIFFGVRLSRWDSAATVPRTDGAVAKVFGGPGGTPTSLSCEGPARGLIVSRSEGHVAGAALLCDSNPPRIMGKPSPESTTLRCPDECLFAGIWGKYDAFVSDLAPLCRCGEKIEKMPLAGAEGIVFEFLCPREAFIREMFGAAGDLVDRIGIVCQKPSP